MHVGNYLHVFRTIERATMSFCPSLSLFSSSTHAIHSISTDPHRVQSPLDAIGDKRSRNDSRSHNWPRLECTLNREASYGFISNCTELQRSLGRCTMMEIIYRNCILAWPTVPSLVNSLIFDINTNRKTTSFHDKISRDSISSVHLNSKDNNRLLIRPYVEITVPTTT